jgi:2-polyprenyl-6-methoxyphenol hydroxylase-like FAD-dependent oxidoreductase
MYDVIVVGARVAGAATAMLLARKGLRVLAVDRASFPSDTISTHQVHLPGVAALHRFGLLDRVAASNAPATRRVTFDLGPSVLRGQFPEHRGVDALFSPRRTVLDAILVDAAREAGAEVRERWTVDEIVRDGDAVTGVRGRSGTGTAVTERARLVVGADGKHSTVAAAVGAAVRKETAPRSVAAYTYWSGVELTGGEMYSRPCRAVGAWPTNDGLVLTYVAWPAAEFDDFRRDVEGNVVKTLDLAGDLGTRVRAGTRAERVRTTPDVPNAVRQAYGPGWALVGDAGVVMDPITGQGISHALCQAEWLADAVEAGLSGRLPLYKALAGYQKERDRQTRAMYDFTVQLASFQPPRPEEELLFAALAQRPAEVERFFGVLAGAVPMREYFAPGNLLRLVGARGLARMMVGRMRFSARSDR